MSQSHNPGADPTPVERELRAGSHVGDLTPRPQLRVVRNQVGLEGLPAPSGSPLRNFSPDRVGASGDRVTFPDMKETTLEPSGLDPTILRRLAARPERGTRVVAKAISRMQPEVVVPRAADPAALVDLHRDLRLSLQRLATETGSVLAERYTVAALATGCIELVPTAELDRDDVESTVGLELRVDPRNRLRLTKGIAHRLAVEIGHKVLVTLEPGTGSLRLLNLATLADAFEAQINATRDDASTPSQP